MIEIKNLVKSYGENTVYDNFGLSVEEGKVTCLLGESGSGKTTLLNCIAGLTPCKGEIPKLKCAYIFQTPRLVPNLTVEGNLKLVCKDADKIADMLARVRLTEKSRCYPIKLSGGEAQRAAIARAFLYGGDAILMDEPFASLDIKLKKEMVELFFEVWGKDRPTALFVTHDVEEACTVAHRALILRRGKIIADVKPETEPPRAFTSCGAMREELTEALLR